MEEVLWFLHNYPPVCLGGAEFAAHRINLWLLKRGYKVKVYILDGFSDPKAYPSEFEGVQITYLPPHQVYSFKPSSPNTIVASQLWATRQARQIYEMNNTKYIEFVHYVDHTVVSPYPWTSRRDFTMVYNSCDTKERSLKLAPWLEQVKTSYMMHPPMDDVLPVVPRTESHVYPWITLVNFNRDKGAEIFNAVAAADSSRQYIAIKGGHGEQCTPVKEVTLLDPTRDMNSIYDKTRILVVPSKYETWSLVASEANARGIPVVTIDTMPALRENCGDAAFYIPADVQSDPKQWIQAFQTIESNYAEFSSAAIKRRYDIEPILLKLFP
jgi:glycosyltransferase involved in cell wall biosynthesis